MIYVGQQPNAYPTSAITVLSFRNRFTLAEKVAIELAALDNPNGTLQARQMAATLRANLADTFVATHIDLNRIDTRAGVQLMETFGLIAVGRASEILDSPILDSERPVVR